MRRRRTTRLKPTKAQHYKTKAKRNTALKAGRRANSSVADLQEQIERQARELDAALERETAAAEVLRVISSSPGDLKPVFEAIISNAQRICGARFGNLVLFDGKNMRVVAMHNAAPEHMAMRQRDPSFRWSNRSSAHWYALKCLFTSLILPPKSLMPVRRLPGSAA